MIVRRQEPKIINRKEVTAIVCVHKAFPLNGEYQELYAIPRYIHVTKEGPPEEFFGVAAIDEQENEVQDDGAIPEEVRGALHGAPTDNEINLVHTNGIMVDDDNEPAPENTPSPRDTETQSIFGKWEQFTGICLRRAASVPNIQPRLKHFPRDVLSTKLQLFEMMFPKTFVCETMIPAMNAVIKGPEVTYGKFIQWLGIWLIISCVQGFTNYRFT